MPDVKERPVRRDAKDGRFIVDKEYVKEQATEAVMLFLAPLSGVYAAAKGRRRHYGRTERKRA